MHENKSGMDRSKIIDTLKQRGAFITPGEVSALANNMIDVERIVPHGVLCLYSAFAHYGLSTQVPSATCIAIEAKRKVRLPEYPPIDLYYWKKENLQFGIVKKNISVYEILITDMERTVCDAVKYRNKI